LSDERGRALINEGLEVRIVNNRERQVEEIASLGTERRKEAVEENRMEDS
jgi:hypothetical protein